MQTQEPRNDDMMFDLPVILIALICISPAIIVMVLFYIVLVEAEVLRKEEKEKSAKRKDLN